MSVQKGQFENVSFITLNYDHMNTDNDIVFIKTISVYRYVLNNVPTVLVGKLSKVSPKIQWPLFSPI